MKKIHRIGTLITALILAMSLGACNKEDDKLVLVTTESKGTTDTELSTTESVTTESQVTEEISDRDKGITYQDMYEANRGDVLLSGGTSYGMNTIYYSGDKEVYSEYQFLGFDAQGMYAQVYEDSEGRVEILDAANNYWYVVDGNQLSVLIYPEPYVASAIVDSKHNAFIFTLSAGEDATEIVENVYRENGKLVVETVFGNSEGENYQMEYILDDDWGVEEYYCYNMDQEKISHSIVTAGDTYEVPEVITEAQAMTDGYRTITVTYMDSDEMDMVYYAPVDIPVEISLMDYVAYSDAACTTVWAEAEPDENGIYKDVTIYMKEDAKEGE